MNLSADSACARAIIRRFIDEDRFKGGNSFKLTPEDLEWLKTKHPSPVRNQFQEEENKKGWSGDAKDAARDPRFANVGSDELRKRLNGGELSARDVEAARNELQFRESGYVGSAGNEGRRAAGYPSVRDAKPMTADAARKRIADFNSSEIWGGSIENFLQDTLEANKGLSKPQMKAVLLSAALARENDYVARNSGSMMGRLGIKLAPPYSQSEIESKINSMLSYYTGDRLPSSPPSKEDAMAALREAIKDLQVSV